MLRKVVRSRRARRLRRFLAGVLLAAGLLTLASFVLLRTEMGRQRLADLLSRRLSSDGLTVRIERLRFQRATRLEMGSLSVADKDGVWLTLRKMDLTWNPFRLRNGFLDVRQSRIESLDLKRLPAAGSGEPAGKKPSLSSFRFRVEALMLDEARVEATVFGFPVVLSGVRGSLQGTVSNGVARAGLKAASTSLAMGGLAVERVAVDMDLSVAQFHWGLPRFEISGDGVRGSGSLDFTGGGAWPTGNLEAEADGSAGWAGSLWPGLSGGKVAFNLRCEPRQNERETLDVAMTVSGLRVHGAVVAGATMHAQVRGPLAQTGLSVEAVARVEGFSAGTLVVTGAEVHVSGPWRTAKVVGAAGGVFQWPFSAEVSGRLQCEEGRRGIEVQRAALNWAGMKVQLVEPLRIWRDGEQTAISAAWHAESIDLSSVPYLPAGVVAGLARGDLRVQGTLASPAIAGNVVFEGLRARSRSLAGAPALEGSCGFDCSAGALRVSTEVRLATGGVVRIRVELPAQVSLQPWALRLDSVRNASVAVEARLNLAALNGLDTFANGRIGGRLDLSMAQAGPISAGGVTGTCVLVDGEYENYVLGTVVRNARVRLVAQGDTLTIESGNATDGGSGRFTAAGRVRLSPAKGLPFALAIDCRGTRILRRPDVETTVSGKIALEGTMSRVRLDGDLEVGDALIELRNVRRTPPVALIPLHAAELPESKSMAAGTNVTLRLAVAIPGSLHIRGRGVDSQWGGRLVFGYAGGLPDVSGYLEPRSGTITLLRRQFKLTEGRIQFDGRWPPEPSLRLAAAYSRADLRAQVRVVGSARAPEITLTSDPALPENEILARILFGQEMTTVTPLQALSLASEASKLRGGGGGASFLADMQTAVGIDSVEVREGSAGKSASEVAIGKYLGDSFYVEVRRATLSNEPGGFGVHVEHQLRKNIVLEANSGPDTGPGIGILWRKDY